MGAAVVAGKKLGRYEVLKLLATGGMAEVLLARSSGLSGFEHHVVIKRIRAEQARDARFVKMFLDEARLAGSLHHQNIVKVHDVGEERGEYFIAMEYVHGEDLCRLIVEITRTDAKFPIDQAVAIIMNAAAGLHHAHEQLGADGSPLGLVHRDVSPGNILVGYDGSVKVTDFGIAKATFSSNTQSGTLKGKVGYMSPEQIIGHAIDRRSDVWSLGVVLYEALTGRRLFRSGNDFLTMAAIVDGRIPPPSEHRRDLPPALQQIIMKALAPNRDDRFQTADELRAALERFVIASELRTSTKKLSDFMHALLGERREPWLVFDAPTDLKREFDHSPTGVVQAPDAALRHFRLPDIATGPTSLIAIARDEAITGGAPVVQPDTLQDKTRPTAVKPAEPEEDTDGGDFTDVSETVTSKHEPEHTTHEHEFDDAVSTMSWSDRSPKPKQLPKEDKPPPPRLKVVKPLARSPSPAGTARLPAEKTSVPARVLRLSVRAAVVDDPEPPAMPRWLPWIVFGAVIAAAVAIVVVIQARSKASVQAVVVPSDAAEVSPPEAASSPDAGRATEPDPDDDDAVDDSGSGSSKSPKKRKRKRSRER